jgi:hypothetical protein
MHSDLYNIYTLLPFDNHVKYNIYSQMYKHHYTIPNELKADIISYVLLDKLTHLYKEACRTDEMSSVYYIMYCDLVQEQFVSDYDDIIRNDTFDVAFLFYDNYHQIVADVIVINRDIENSTSYFKNKVKHLWTKMNSNRRIEMFNEFKYSNHSTHQPIHQRTNYL